MSRQARAIHELKDEIGGQNLARFEAAEMFTKRLVSDSNCLRCIHKAIRSGHQNLVLFQKSFDFCG